MGTVQIVCDSTADVDAADVAAWGLTVVPLRVIFGEEAFRDRVDLSVAQFYERLSGGRHYPRTSQPTPAEFEAVFRQVGAGGDPIVCTTISAGLSGTYGSAVQARQALPDMDIRVVDTQSVAPGHYAAVALAAAAREQGAGVDEIVQVLERLRASQRLVFGLNTLEFLKRGGRIGGAQAFVGTMLSIKPILALEGGKVEAISRVRTYPRALDRLVEMLAEASRAWGPTVAITAHAASPERAAEVAARVSEITGQSSKIIEIGPVIACHSGPDAIGLHFHPALDYEI